MQDILLRGMCTYNDIACLTASYSVRIMVVSRLSFALQHFSLFTIPLGTCEKTRPVNAKSHYHYYNLNDLNTEKIPAKRLLDPRQNVV